MTDAPLTTAAIGPTDAPDLRIVRDRSLYERRFKRPFDVVAGLLLCVVALPLIAVIAVLIRLRLGQGVFYRQERVGQNGRIFTIWKFRTMRPDRRREQASIETDRRTTHKANHDPRHTRLGRLLRKLSLDELPQLWNVLRGDMSLVGPRPLMMEYLERYDSEQARRHEVRPGVTGLATLRFHKREEVLLAGCATAEETDRVYRRRCVPVKARLDLIYQKNASVCFDLALIWETARGVLKR